VLRDTGYDVIDSFYTPRALELPVTTLQRRRLNVPRKLLFALEPDWTVRLLGGFSLLVLAQ
jgi:hypothetical protein